jgi:hypothetical protein
MMDGPHTAGTVCPECGQHHTGRSAAAHNDGTAPADVTAQLLDEQQFAEITLPAGLRAATVIVPAGLDEITFMIHREEAGTDD